MLELSAITTPQAIWGLEDLLVVSAFFTSIALFFKSLQRRRNFVSPVRKGGYLFLASTGAMFMVLFSLALFGGWRTSMTAGKSMMPTMAESNIIVTGSYAYGVRVPFSGWLKGPRAPRTGDIAMFHARVEGEQMLLAKRVVAISGDRVTYQNGSLFVNGNQISGAPSGRGHYAGPILVQPRQARVSTTSFHVLAPQPGQDRLYFEGTVPADHVFLMGDNWAQSYDSREFGPVPFSSLRGRVRWAWSESTGWVSL